MNIENITPPFIGRKNFAPLRPVAEPRAAIRKTRHPLLILVKKVETQVVRDKYTHSRDDNEPMLFVVHVTGEIDGIRTYFKHTVRFMRLWGKGDKFERPETDFVAITRVGESHNIRVKINPGDTISVHALKEERMGNAGYPYYSLSRVQLCR